METPRHPDSHRFDSTANLPKSCLTEIAEKIAKLTADGKTDEAAKIMMVAQADGHSVTAIMGSARYMLTSGKLKGRKIVR